MFANKKGLNFYKFQVLATSLKNFVRKINLVQEGQC